ncbi:sodium-dependent transporter [Vibrio variabilis]|uniref:Sodium-dependent transporter n=1 Tax=Vibrio variabilis TaxID=990271 RepID=A0ABQ0JGZ4_9VIBR|nr:sodium-dependent transporter [Vibrio variabilis]
MPSLFILFALLFVYIMMQQGAVEGLKHYLILILRKYGIES